MFPLHISPTLRLKPLSALHGDTLYDLIESNREHLRTWFNWIDTTNSIDDVLDFISTGRQKAAKELGGDLGIWSNNTLVGVLAIKHIDWDSFHAELGYWLAANHQGQGIMTDSCRALITYLFQTIGLHRIEIRCAQSNHKSCAIAQRLGFIPEGTLRQAYRNRGEFLDIVIYGLLASDWSHSNS